LAKSVLVADHEQVLAGVRGAQPKSCDYRLAIDLRKGMVFDNLEPTNIETVRVRTGWKAAQRLGPSRETLRDRIEKHNLTGLNLVPCLLIRVRAPGAIIECRQ